jgi:hypothetical protein
MEQENKPKYGKPEIRELGRAGDDEMRAVGDCTPTGSGDAGNCDEGNSAGGSCWAGPSAGFCAGGVGHSG